jgi:hypothetical protein
MPVNYLSESLSGISNSNLVLAALGGITAYGLKVATGGRKSIWEREWAGKLIMVVVRLLPLSQPPFAIMRPSAGVCKFQLTPGAARTDPVPPPAPLPTPT